MLNQQWQIDPVVEDWAVGPVRVFHVNEGDSEEGTWSRIATFYHQHDANLFIKAKQENQEAFNKAAAESLKRQGGALKKLADL